MFLKVVNIYALYIKDELEMSVLPYLHHFNSEINLSHSGSWVICSIGRCNNGVDVETETADFEEIARHFFCQNNFLL